MLNVITVDFESALPTVKPLILDVGVFRLTSLGTAVDVLLHTPKLLPT